MFLGKVTERIRSLALIESLNRGLSYLRGGVSLRLAEHGKQNRLSATTVKNVARRQEFRWRV